MKPPIRSSAALVAGALLAMAQCAQAQTSPAIPPSITTPDRVDSRIGVLEFRDGAPSQATLDKVYDHVDFTHAYEAFVNTMQGSVSCSPVLYPPTAPGRFGLRRRPG